MTAVVLGAGIAVVTFVRQELICWAATAKEGEDLDCDVWWVLYQTAIPNAIAILFSAICCILCFAFNIASVATMIVLRSTGKLRQKAPEFRLFVHSLFMFLLQIFVAFQDIIHVLDNINVALSELGINLIAWDRPDSTEWLAGVKGTRIPISDSELYFMPGCTVDTRADEQQWCSTWYRVLIGELRLRDYPDKFTIRSLLQTLLAISGSAFLLIISGHVRNAYFEFYFGFLRRKQTQCSNVNVVQVAPARQAIVSSVSGTFSSP